MKIGIAGSGMIVSTFLSIKEYLDNIEIASICGRKHSFEKMLGMNIPNVYTDYEEMLKTDIDTVYIAVPNSMHYEYGIKAIEYGKNLIVEKPITSNYKEAKALFDKAVKKGVFVFEAITMIQLENYKKIAEYLKKIGNIKIVECNYSQYSSRYDKFLKGDPAPVFRYEMSGGAFMDLNLYNIYFVIGLFGKPLNAVYYPNIEQNIDTSGIAVLEYDKFKAVCIGAKDCKADPFCIIEGDKGFIRLNSAANACDDFTVKTDNEEKEYNYNLYSHRMTAEFIEFERIVREKDYIEAKRLMDLSLDVSETMTNARLSANYKFPADEK